MPKPPYLGRALLALLVGLPILFQTLLVIFGVLFAVSTEALDLPATLTATLVIIIAGGVLLVVSARFGRRAVIRAHAPFAHLVAGISTEPPEIALPPDRRAWVRYQPLVFVFSYTLALALIGLLLPVPKEGALYGNFLTVFLLPHITSGLAIVFATLFSAPSPWLYLAPPLAIYSAYGVGMVLAFRHLRAPATLLPGRVALLACLVTALAFAAWRADAITTGFLRDTDTPALPESYFTERYHPLQPGNKLVPVPTPGLAITDRHPRLDGATALYPVYAAAAQAIYKNTDAPSLRKLVDYSTTPKAYERLIRGEVDLILVAQPSPAQRAAAQAAGVELKLTPIGREAFVFFVHSENPVTALTPEQIRAIYTKRLTNWSALGGQDGPILPFQRPAGSGSQTALELKVMQGEPLPAPLREEYSEGMGGIIQRVAAYRNSRAAIGYSFRVFATVMSPVPDIKLLAIDGVAPTPETIRSGAYPYTVEIFAATAGTPNPHVPALIAWFLGPEGQRLIEQTGYVALPTPRAR